MARIRQDPEYRARPDGLWDLMKAAGVDVKPSSVQIATILKDIVGRAEQVRQFDAGERLEGNIVEFIYTHLDTLEREHAPRDAWGRILADASQRFGLAEDAISGVLRKWGIARRVAPMPKHRVPLISDEERAFLLRGPKVAQATRFKTTSSIASPPMKTCAGRSHGELEK